MGMTADMGAAWGTAALQTAPTGYYPYDPALAAYGYVNFTFFSLREGFFL